MHEDKPPILVFHHIPKTAGTSLRSWLWRALGREQVFWHGEGEDGFIDDVIEQRGCEFFDRIAVIGGHIPFSNAMLHKLPHKKIRMAIIRRPIDQVVSHFEYVSHLPEHPLYAGDNLEHALVENTPFLRESTNMQLRYLTNRETFVEAQQVFKQNSFIIGCFDQISIFLDHIGGLLNIGNLELPYENKQKSGYFERHCTPHAAEIIREITRQDELLYQKVKASGVLADLDS